MKKLTVRGDAFTRGLTQGKHFGDRALHDAKDALTRLPMMPRGLPGWARPAFVETVVTAAGRFYLSRHAPRLRSHQGGKYEQALLGMAQGLGVAPARLYGYHAFEVASARFTFTLGCTSFAFAAGSTASGHPLIAYNHDFPPQFDGLPCVRENLPEDGWPSVSVTYPVTLGALCGVNAAGLAVSLNHAYVRRVSMGEALPISMLVQDVLDRCGDVSEAIEAMQGVPVANGSMATLADASGARAVVELTPAGAFVRHGTGPVQHTFNAFLTDGARRLEVPIGAVGSGLIAGIDIHGANLGRQARFDALGAGLKTRWSAEEIDALMADHGDGVANANTICRHEDELSNTLLTARIDPVGRTLSVGLGTACRAQRRTYRVPVEGSEAGLHVPVPQLPRRIDPTAVA